jgi:hypothetical protein
MWEKLTFYRNENAIMNCTILRIVLHYIILLKTSKVLKQNEVLRTIITRIVEAGNVSAMIQCVETSLPLCLRMPTNPIRGKSPMLWTDISGTGLLKRRRVGGLIRRKIRTRRTKWKRPWKKLC